MILPTVTTLPKRVVLDTNVILEGVTKRDGSCGLIVDAALAGMFDLFVSNTLLHEYDEILARKLSPHKFQSASVILGRLLRKAQLVKLYFRWRPISPDPDDDMVIECAIHVNAAVVTSNIKDFRAAQRDFGVVILKPSDMVRLLI